MADEELQEQIRDLAKKMQSVEEAMDRVAGPYSQMLEYIERFQKISGSYFRMLGLYQRYGAISPDLLIPGEKQKVGELLSSLPETPEVTLYNKQWQQVV